MDKWEAEAKDKFRAKSTAGADARVLAPLTTARARLTAGPYFREEARRPLLQCRQPP